MTNSLQHRSEVIQDRFGLQVAGRLSAASADLPYDISERLRAARVQAVSSRKVSKLQTATAVHANGGTVALNFGEEGFGLWGRVASFMPLIALVSSRRSRTPNHPAGSAIVAASGVAMARCVGWSFRADSIPVVTAPPFASWAFWPTLTIASAWNASW